MSTDQAARDRLIRVVSAHVQVTGSDYDWSGGSLRDQGLDSMSVIELVLDLESEYDITFPDNLLVAETFETLESLRAAVDALVEQAGR